MSRRVVQVLLAMLVLGAFALAQGGPGMGMGPGGGQMNCPMMAPGGGPGMGPGMGHGMMGHGMMGHGMMGPGMHGKWWKNSELVKKLGITDQQVQQIEKTFQDHRLQLVDLQAALAKQELTLQPLVDAAQPDEAKVVAQIDRVAQARADLEKSHARMLLSIRRVLTPEQWKQLQNPSGGAPMQHQHNHGAMSGSKAGNSKM